MKPTIIVAGSLMKPTIIVAKTMPPQLYVGLEICALAIYLITGVWTTFFQLGAVEGGLKVV